MGPDSPALVSQAEALLDISGLCKAFSGTSVLKSVNLSIASGEIHGLLGANGSGKSTLIKILAGVQEADSGELRMFGEVCNLKNSANGSGQLPISFVHQDLGLSPKSTVLEHFAMDGTGAAMALRGISWSAEGARVAKLLSKFHVSVDMNALAGDLLPVQQAQVAIVRALAGHVRRSSGDGPTGPQLLVLDEPTVFLAQSDVNLLFETLETMRRSGDSVLLVSHDLEEVLAISDRISVLRDGSNAGTCHTASTDRGSLVELILGEPSKAGTRNAGAERERGEILLSAHSISGGILRDFSLDLYQGEVVGITGLAGSGFEEVPELLYGARQLSGGTVSIDGKRVHRPTPRASISSGVVLVPADRKMAGSAAEATVLENLALPIVGEESHWSKISWKAVNRRVRAACRRLSVKPSDPAALFKQLSGGNQQKAILGKWLQVEPRVLLLSEPTQGVDVGARREIFDIVRSSLGQGTSYICVTSDYEQLVEIADRVLILENGRLIQTLTGQEITKGQIAAELYIVSAA